MCRTAQIVGLAEAFAEEQLDPSLHVRGVVVVGSVARGDYHEASDVDAIVVAHSVPTAFLERSSALGPVPSRVEPVVWTSGEWRRQRQRQNPLVVDTLDHGVWLIGSPDKLERALD